MNGEDHDTLDRFRRGDKEAANKIISRLYDRVVAAAKKRIGGVRLHATSEEDIAASVFESLWDRAQKGGFTESDLATEEELWRLLSVMVRFKARDHLRNEGRLKRGGAKLQGESAFGTLEDGSPNRIHNFAVDKNSLNQTTDFMGRVRDLLSQLGNEDLREVAVMRLEGYEVKEIAAKFERSDRWVKRKLALIREKWSSNEDDGE